MPQSSIFYQDKSFIIFPVFSQFSRWLCKGFFGRFLMLYGVASSTSLSIIKAFLPSCSAHTRPERFNPFLDSKLNLKTNLKNLKTIYNLIKLYLFQTVLSFCWRNQHSPKQTPTAFRYCKTTMNKIFDLSKIVI